MDQYAVYENKGGGKAAYPFLLNIHHSSASGFGNTVMVPLVPLARLMDSPPKKLCPLLKIEHQQYVVMTHMLGGVKSREIGDQVRQLDGEIYEVKNAFDFLLNGI
ncbi:CcdB family protein [Rahnella woolbedingensis]|uniref:Toxin CcdB n=1 Tax=Rahnella woolbedingensis TaxID=1510574 RepID=A0A419N805_9GAMM|nr:CcdB family protein [Rahnella woolbedingensis]RJT43590.1 taxon MazF [Rahnella woolbedingensis]